MSSKTVRVALSAKSVKVCTENCKEKGGTDEDSMMYQNKDVPMCNKNEKVLQWFIKFTSIGGFTQTRDSDNKISQFVWGALFLLGLVMTCFGIVKLVIQFCRYEAITNVELGHNSSGMIFPAVTVCNQNRIHCGHLYDKIISCSKVNVYWSIKSIDFYSFVTVGYNDFVIFKKFILACRTRRVQREKPYIARYL